MERRAITIRGIVQGVGFRPFVYLLARRLGLCGHVKNQTGSVLIEVEGPPAALERFLAEVVAQAPPLAQIDGLTWEPRPPRGDDQFRIEGSTTDAASPVYISPDVATCADCLRELFDPADRRCGYPFLNCTHCGPRLTIITGAPYDRPRTTLAAFPMCAACRAEYDNPADRRFHAQPTACPACGPRLQLLDAQGRPVVSAAPLADFVAALRAGQVGALKGLGGYHLVCDATDPQAVAALRSRKHREEKPFAIMVPDVAAAAALGVVGTAERELLRSPACPIVLLRRRGPGTVAAAVAPGNPWLGVMLPYTPLHHLLMRAVGGRPLVMTSGNRADEPIAYQDDEAVTKLSGIADCFLIHNRPIHVRCDDSVLHVVADVPLPVRRSRGYAPRPVELPVACPGTLLAVGGQLKVTFALGHGRQAFLSHHMGDLDHFEAYQQFVTDVALYQELFAVRPGVLVHDLHPDYATTHYAQERAERERSRRLAVQHHHAHVASCMAEHRLTGPVIGVAFDGTGYGTDGAIWGGEFLIGDYRAVQRAAHLRYVGMPGGEQAIREPWRMAAAHLADAQAECPALAERIAPLGWRTVRQMLERRLNTPLTSSAGRLFDAVASLAGVRDRVCYEGQAAVELEWLAMPTAVAGAYPFEVLPAAAAPGPLVIDTRPVIQAVAADVRQGVAAARIARRFQQTMVEVIASVCGRLRSDTGLTTVVLSGGVFLNVLLTSEACARLTADGFRVYRHRVLPPTDGGLSLGQLAVAAAQLAGTPTGLGAADAESVG